MAHIIINSKGQYFGHQDSWREDLKDARLYTNKGAAKNSYRQTRKKEAVLIQEVALMLWGAPEVYEPKP